jgi:protein-L-isoaspartate(D-aspartate) O-methyltransferase
MGAVERSEQREEMVRAQIRSRGVRDERVLAALSRVPRHLFVPKELEEIAYEDRPLPIGREQTISQPYIVAFMSEAAGIKASDRVLEVGTGSGYQTAVLAELGAEVYTIELVEELAKRAEAVLRGLGYANIHARVGDGARGWKEAAPFDVIVVTAAPEKVPQPLLDQLNVAGRLVIPVGGGERQALMRIVRTGAGLNKETLLPVSFVPLVSEDD